MKGDNVRKGVILHFDGMEWLQEDVNYDVPFRNIWGNSEKNIYVIGYYNNDSILLRFDGDNWNEMTMEGFEDIAPIAIGFISEKEIIFGYPFGELVYYNDGVAHFSIVFFVIPRKIARAFHLVSHASHRIDTYYTTS